MNHSGEEVSCRFLFKNLQQSFRQHLHLSGCKSFVPMIRNSAELFGAFDDYYQLFHPQGGRAMS